MERIARVGDATTEYPAGPASHGCIRSRAGRLPGEVRRGLLGRHMGPIDVGRVGVDRQEFAHQGVVRGEMAHWVGCARIAGEREGLATATAEIDVAAFAAAAWLPHPVGAPKGAEGGRGLPDFRERMIADRPEIEAW